MSVFLFCRPEGRHAGKPMSANSPAIEAMAARTSAESVRGRIDYAHQRAIFEAKRTGLPKY
jgi:hypothetical protein